MKSRILNTIAISATAIAAMTMTSCLSSGDDTILLSPEEIKNPLGIPSDDEATEAPAVPNPTVNIPGVNSTVNVQDGWAYIALTMNGIWDNASNGWLNLRGTGMPGQNTWVTVDGVPKGIDIYNNSESQGRVIATDVVFLVDNSGSMSEEANAIATSIIEWVDELSLSGIDLRAGCVGYDVYGDISGAINMTTPQALYDYLNRTTGTSRTVGFSGSDATTLQANARDSRYSAPDECGMAALHFAHDNFNFRSNANRVYINFTDEGNQPGSNTYCSVEWLNPKSNNWNPAYGTIHTVYSGSGVNGEDPALMSTYTGGTTLKTNSSFAGVTLSSLPVTGAIANSYIIRFTNVDHLLDGKPHSVTITIISADGAIRAVRTFDVVFQSAE